MSYYEIMTKISQWFKAFRYFFQLSPETSLVKASNSNLGILAMSTINEIMYKNCIPPDFENYLLQMFKNTFQLLQAVVQDQGASSASVAKLANLDET